MRNFHGTPRVLLAAIFGTLALIPITFDGQSVAQDQVKLIQLDENVNDWTVDPMSNRIFAALDNAENEVIELDIQGNEVRRIQISKTPRELLIKNNKLIVAAGEVHFSNAARRRDAPKQCAVFIFDLTSNKVQGKIEFEGHSAHSLCCSKVDNSFAYVVISPQGKLHQIDLESIQAKQDPNDQDLRSCFATTMSDDGKWMIVNPDSPTKGNVTLWRINESEFSATQNEGRRWTPGPVSAATDGQSWLFGDEVFRTQGENAIRWYSGNLGGGFHPQFDIVVTSNEREVFISEHSTSKRLTKFPVSSSLNVYDQRQQPKLHEQTQINNVLFNNQNMLFVTRGRTCNIANLNDFGFPLNPHKKPPEPIEFGAIGKLKFDFAIRKFEIDERGERAIVFGQFSRLNFNEPQSLGDMGPYYVSVVDLNEQKILLTKELAEPELTLAVDDKYVYLSPNERNSLIRLDRDTLSNPRRLLIDSQCVEIHPIPGGRIIVKLQSPGQSTFHWEILDRESGRKLRRSSRPMKTNEVVYRRKTTDSYELNGTVFDINTGEPIITTNSIFDSLSSHPKETQSTPRRSFPRDGNQPVKTPNFPLDLPFESLRHSLLGDAHSWKVPVRYFLRAGKQPQSPDPSIYLICRESDGDEIIYIHPLCQAVENNHLLPAPDNSNRLKICLDKGIVATRNEILIFRLPELEKSQYSTPINVAPEKVRPIQVNGEQEVVIKIEGAMGGCDCTLINPLPGIKFDSTTSSVKLNTDQLWSDFSKPFLDTRASKAPFAPRLLNHSRLLIFRELYGRELGQDKVPFAIPIQIAAYDDEGRLSEVKFYVTLVGTLQDLEDKRETKRLMDAQFKELREAEMEEENRILAQKAESLMNRAAELEKRILKMEENLELIHEKLKQVDQLQPRAKPTAAQMKVSTKYPHKPPTLTNPTARTSRLDSRDSVD